MADKEKKVKKKKKEEGSEAPAAPAETRTSSKSSSKKAKRSGSNVFSMFSQAQIAEFKECFQLMDHDKDGIITKPDLRATFDDVGKLSSEKELDEMINEAPGPMSFTQFIGMFGTRMADTGGTDEDEVIIAAFKAFDEDGVINGQNFRKTLMSYGESLTEREVNEAFEALDIDEDGYIDTFSLINLLTARCDDEVEAA